MIKIFLKQTSLLFGASLLSQIINMSALVVIAIVYNPLDFGEYAIITSISSVIIVVVSFQLPTIILSSRREDIPNLVSNHFFTALLVSVAAIAILLNLNINNLERNWYSEIALYVLLLTSSGVLFQISNSSFIKLENYKVLSLVIIVKSLVLVFSQYYLGKQLGGVMALVLSLYFSEILFSLCFLACIYYSNIRLKKVSFKCFSKELFVNKRDYSIWGTLQDAMNAVAHSSPVLLLSLFFTKEQVGLYSFAYRIIESGVSLISGSLRNVLLNILSSIKSDKIAFYHFLKKVWLILTLSTSVGGILACIMAENVFEVMFDKKWMESSYYIILLMPWFIMLIVNIPATTMLKCFGIQKSLFWLNLFILLSRVILIYIAGVLGFTITTVVLLFSMYNMLCNFVYIYVSISKVKKVYSYV